VASIYVIAEEQRQRVFALDRRARARTLRAYAIAYTALSRELAALLSEIEAAQAAGEAISAAWLLRRERYHRLLEQTALHVRRFADVMGTEITATQRIAVEAALAHSARLVAVGVTDRRAPRPQVVAEFNRVPAESLEYLVGYLSDGSPLKEVTLRSFTVDAVAQVDEALIEGLSVGKNPRQIGRRIQQALDVPRYRAERIARTEVLRSYRSAATSNYEANSDVLEGYVRLAALDTRTCPVCWALHMTRYRLGEQIEVHPNCRCTPAPLVIGKTYDQPAGPAAFAALPPEDQMAILGRAKYDLYSRGEMRLEDLVDRREDPTWGGTLRERSLAEISGRQAA
jgi:SPP1 gp7 family putative phage head morphogenesis protein